MMKKLTTMALVAALGLFGLAACSNTVASMETASGGEVDVVASEIGSIEQTVSPENAPEMTGTADYEALNITYTDPEGYTKTVGTGGEVTYSLDGEQVGKIVYVPEIVQAAALDKFYAALQDDAAMLKEYAQQFAADYNTDFTATPVTINGYNAIEITGTVTEAADGLPAAEAKAYVIAIGDQLVTISGVADEATAAQVQADMDTFANSIQVEPRDASMSISASSSSSMSSSMSGSSSSSMAS